MYYGGVIKVIYNILLTQHASSLSTGRSQWEVDSASEITDLNWQPALCGVHSSSICARHGLPQIKALTSPIQSCLRFTPGEDPLCYRFKRETGSLAQTVCTGPSLHRCSASTFWHVFSESPPSRQFSEKHRRTRSFPDIVRMPLLSLPWLSDTLYFWSGGRRPPAHSTPGFYTRTK